MLSSILVALDGSESSHAAIELAIDLAQQHSALVAGIGIANQPAITTCELSLMGAGTIPERGARALLHQETSHVTRVVDEFVSRCTQAQVVSKPLQGVGVPADEISLQAQRYDLTIVGQQTFFDPLNSNQPDDTLSQLIKTSPRPLIVAPAKRCTGSTVLVAYDGSAPAARALQVFQLLGIFRELFIEVVTVGENHLAAAETAERAIDFLTHCGRKTRRYVADAGSGDPATAILRIAENTKPQMLVMGTHSQGAFREFFSGATTRHFLSGATMPIFCSN